MEVLVSGIVLILAVLLGLVLAAPGLAIVIAVGLPIGAIVLLARLLHLQPRPAQQPIAWAPATLVGAHAASSGIGAAPIHPLRETAHPQPRSRRHGNLVPSANGSLNRLQAIAPEFRSGEALFAFDRNLTVVSWNKAAARLTGIPAEDALGRPCWELLGGVDADGNTVCHAGCPGARLASQGSPVNGQRLLINTATGARKAAWLSTIAVRAGDEPLTLHLLRNGLETPEQNAPQREPEPAEEVI